ncbi:MAG: ATPase [Treponema sp.]|nr:ATPase [Treponema sp.]
MKAFVKRRFFIVAVLMAVISVTAVSAQSASDQSTAAEVQEKDGASSSAIKYLAAALAVGIACVGGGMAVGKIGAAAMGAMSENAELSGKALPFVGLAEGICLWGFLVALFIILM